MMERLQKVLAQAGFGSRRKCEDLITDGQVEVDGRVVTELGTKVDPDSQKIKCLGRFVKAPRKLYFVLHKPTGYISSTRDERGRKTVMEFFQGLRERIYPIGRLDKDSEGLLLFTNDGELTNLLTHPRYQVERTYYVILRGRLEDAVKNRIERGVWLAEGRTGPAQIRIKKLLTQETVLDITIKEGLNREVRRIFAKFGLKVRRLKRIQIGPLSLGSLSVGAIRPLTPNEVRELRAHALRGVTDEKP